MNIYGFDTGVLLIQIFCAVIVTVAIVNLIRIRRNERKKR